MKNIKCLLISIAIPLVVGLIGNQLGNSSMGFDNINKPSFTPPGIIFPIVWTILYILMGVSCYLIYNSNSSKKTEALRVYALQLIFKNFMKFSLFSIAVVVGLPKSSRAPIEDNTSIKHNLFMFFTLLSSSSKSLKLSTDVA